MNEKKVNRKFSVTGFCSAFSFSWDSEFIFSGESHEMWEIVFVHSGMVEVTENEKVYSLGANNMIIHAPREFHRIRSAGGTSPNLYVMSFFAEGDLPEKLCEGVFFLGIEQALEYNSLFEGIDAFLNSENPPSYLGQGAADRLSAFLIGMSGENVIANAQTSQSAREYRRLVLLMSGAVYENKSLTDFAEEGKSSVSYLKALFKKYAGISPKAYYNNLRLQAAKRLLLEGESVNKVAEIMNFSSSNYFCAFFKKHSGLSPMAYANLPK